MWEAIFNWSELVKFGGDVVTYFILAAVGTSLFLIRLVVALFVGDTSDFDIDADVGTDASFTLFSLLSVMAFIMGTGWMGLACRVDWELNRPLSAFISIAFGVVMMFMASGTMYLIRKLNREVTYDVGTAVGRTAKVYMKIPAKGKGQGKVQVSVSGRLKTIQAVSDGKEIAAFTDVKVVEVRDDETLIVEPLD
jgi:membrane-bound ClpP family serine protease